MSKSKREQVNLTIKKKSKWGVFRDNFELSMMLVPGIIFFLVFSYIPMLGVIIAFKDYRNNLGIFGIEWVGLRNFKFFFTSQYSFRISSITICSCLVFIIL